MNDPGDTSRDVGVSSPTPPAAVDRLWRAAAFRFASRPGMLTRRLGAIRCRVGEGLVETYRPRAAALTPRLAAGDEEARTELAALAESALVEMRSAVAAEARTGIGTRVLAAADRLWGKPGARELMDDPELDRSLRTAILSRLDRFNTSLGSYQLFLGALRPLLRPSGVTRVLDLAAGHGGFALAAARAARDEGLAVELTASDLRREYLDLGAAVARREGLAVRFIVQDARDLSALADEAFDIVTCTQSLHHLPPGLIAVIFESAVRTARRGVVFVDGSRSLRTGAALSSFALLRYRHRAFLHDTWISTRRFYVPEELALLARIGPWGRGVEAAWTPPGFCVLRQATHS